MDDEQVAQSDGAALATTPRASTPAPRPAVSRRGCSVYIAAALLAACTAGPDFKRPEAPRADRYTATPLAATTVSAPAKAGAAQHLSVGAELPAQWWTLYHSPALDGLLRDALARSPSLAAAEAALRQAQETLTAQTGARLYPAIDANLSASRQRSNLAVGGASPAQAVGGSGIFSLYNASVNVSYALDLSGGARRELEGLLAVVDYQRFELEAARLTLTANLVTAAVREALLRARVHTTQEIIAELEKQLELVERRFELGAVARADVLAQRAQLAQTRATLPPLERDLARTRHLIAVLTGQLPSEAALPDFELDQLTLPPDLPVSLPSQLARQRPDIRAAEALLHNASAQIGVATAAQYPQVSITGSFGAQALDLGKLFSGPSVWSLGAGLLQPLFHGGELSARRRATVAAYEQAAAQYRQTVLLAFQDVADSLRAIEDDARTLRAQSDAEAAARAALELSRSQFALGAVSYLSLLNAQRQLQQVRLDLVQAQAARYADTAALFQALGGGWWNGAGPAATATVKTD